MHNLDFRAKIVGWRREYEKDLRKGRKTIDNIY